MLTIVIKWWIVHRLSNLLFMDNPPFVGSFLWDTAGMEGDARRNSSGLRLKNVFVSLTWTELSHPGELVVLIELSLDGLQHFLGKAYFFVLEVNCTVQICTRFSWKLVHPFNPAESLGKHMEISRKVILRGLGSRAEGIRYLFSTWYNGGYPWTRRWFSREHTIIQGYGSSYLVQPFWHGHF